jgi:hypothetical protein
MMNLKTKSYKTEYAVSEAPKLKTFGLRLIANDRDLEKQVQRAFDLAKSAGKELDLVFSQGPSGQVTL